MTKILTAAAVSKISAKSGAREIPDGQSAGLYLIVHASGKKVWALRYRRPADQRPAKLTLGTVLTDGGVAESETPAVGGHLSLAAARRLVAALRHEIALGRDPGQAHLDKKRSGRSANDLFPAAALDFIEEEARASNLDWLEKARSLGFDEDEEGELRMIPRGLADRWRDRRLDAIDEDAIFRVVDEARAKGVPGLESREKGLRESRARRMHRALSTLFGWLKERRRVRVNPVADLTPPKPGGKRDRVLTPKEIVKLWAAAEEEGHPFGRIVQLLLLTGCREAEVAGMRRSEIDGETWTIPGKRTKNKRVHVVNLTPAALALLPAGDDDLPLSTNGETPVSGWSKFKRRMDDRMKIEPWVFHDIRRTVATGMAEIGVMPHVVEAVLNHVSGFKGGVGGVYNRFEYAAEKRAAWQRWDAHVAGLLAGTKGKVLHLRRRNKS